MVNDEQPERFLYFAYGSNMLSARLVARTPSARAHITGHVTGRRITFAKASDDGSGKCDAELTGQKEDRVEGVLFWIDRRHKQALDDAEALGRGYDEIAVDVVTPTGVERGFAYVASAGSTDPKRRPYHWYKALVVAGAIQHRLPTDYIARLRSVQSQDDPLPQRRTKRDAEAALTAAGIAIDAPAKDNHDNDSESTDQKGSGGIGPVADNPTFRKNADAVKGLVAIKDALPIVRPIAELLSVDVATVDGALATADDLQAQHDELRALPDAFNDLFATKGWIIYDYMNLTVVREAIALARGGSIEAAEARLVAYYDPEEVRRQLRAMKGIDAFRPRMRLALKAVDDYEAQRFHACIPVVLALADGMVNEISTARRGFSAARTDLSAWDSIAAHERGLNALKTIFMKGRQSTTTEPLTIPYRHGILHGMDLGYDNAMVAAKTWAALFALRDWAVRAERNDLQAPPPESPPTLLETLQQFKRSDEMTRELAQWTPRRVEIGVDIPSKGPLSAYGEGTAEYCLFQFLSLWQRRNYGHMADALQTFSGKPIPPAEVRAQFDGRVLKYFEFTSVRDAAPAICEIAVNREVEQFGQSRTEQVVYRLCRADASGDPVLASEPDGKWTIAVWMI